MSGWRTRPPPQPAAYNCGKETPDGRSSSSTARASDGRWPRVRRPRRHTVGVIAGEDARRSRSGPAADRRRRPRPGRETEVGPIDVWWEMLRLSSRSHPLTTSSGEFGGSPRSPTSATCTHRGGAAADEGRDRGTINWWRLPSSPLEWRRRGPTRPPNERCLLRGRWCRCRRCTSAVSLAPASAAGPACHQPETVADRPLRRRPPLLARGWSRLPGQRWRPMRSAGPADLDTLTRSAPTTSSPPAAHAATTSVPTASSTSWHLDPQLWALPEWMWAVPVRPWPTFEARGSGAFLPAQPEDLPASSLRPARAHQPVEHGRSGCLLGRGRAQPLQAGVDYIQRDVAGHGAGRAAAPTGGPTGHLVQLRGATPAEQQWSECRQTKRARAWSRRFSLLSSKR